MNEGDQLARDTDVPTLPLEARPPVLQKPPFDREIEMAAGPGTSNETSCCSSNRANQVEGQQKMFKSLSAIAISALLTAALTELPGFAVSAEAVEPAPTPLTNVDRASTPVTEDCSQQVWPNFSPSCLQHVDTKIKVRLVKSALSDK